MISQELQPCPNINTKRLLYPVTHVSISALFLPADILHLSKRESTIGVVWFGCEGKLHRGTKQHAWRMEVHSGPWGWWHVFVTCRNACVSATQFTWLRLKLLSWTQFERFDCQNQFLKSCWNSKHAEVNAHLLNLCFYLSDPLTHKEAWSNSSAKTNNENVAGCYKMLENFVPTSLQCQWLIGENISIKGFPRLDAVVCDYLVGLL